MKKFLSLFCALAIVLSASAAPVKKARAAKFQRAAVEQLRAEKNAPAKKAVKKNALAAKDFASAQNAARHTLSVADKATVSALRAPKALATEAIDVKCGSWEIEDWGTDGQVYLYAEDNTIAFVFDVIYGEGNEDLELGKKYTLAEMDSEYSEVFHDGDWHAFVSAEITKTIDEKGLVHFAGSCVDTLDAAFTFHYDEEEFVPTGDTVKYNFTSKAKMSYSSYYEDWTISADDGVYAFKLDIFSENAESPVGNFISDSADFDLSYTKVEVYYAPDSSNLYAAKSAKASIFVENDTTIILAEILAENGVVYQFGAFYAAPSKQGEASIEATNLVVDDSWFDYFGVILAAASNEEYAVSLTLSAASGTLNAGEDFYGSITNLATEEEIEIYSGSITISNLDGILLTGKVLCENNIEYSLNLSYVLPEPSRIDTINGLGELYLLNQEDLLYWQAIALNADESHYVSLLAIADEPAGTYTLEDLYPQYTYVGVFTAPADTAWYNIIDANITVAVNGEVATISGSLLGQNEVDDADVVEFTLSLNLQLVDERGESGGNQYDSQDQGFYIKFPEYNIDDQYLAKYNVIVVDAQNDDYSYISLEINVPAGSTELPAGEYTVASNGQENTVTAGYIDGYIYGSFAGYLTPEGQINVPLWLINSGTVTVLENGVIEVATLNTWGQGIYCRLGQYPEAIDNTAVKTSAIKRIVNGTLVIEKNGVLYNAQGAQVK